MAVAADLEAVEAEVEVIDYQKKLFESIYFLN